MQEGLVNGNARDLGKRHGLYRACLSLKLMSLCAFTGAQGKAAAVRVRNLLHVGDKLLAGRPWVSGSCFLLPANQEEKFVKRSRKEK